MAHIWLMHEGAWAVAPLQAAGSRLDSLPVGCGGPARGGAILRSGQDWVLLAPPANELLVNGLPLWTGIRVLADRDEVLIDGERLYFSTEQTAAVVPYFGAPVCCPRCKQAIAPGQLSVRCPGCGAIHHQTEEWPCFSYGTTCSLCAQPTDLDAGFQWRPEAA